jgi:demethylmenaquinone methyltransferase/2-methoxy-6-polyprenyl-1,4-benzoquinol methylase
MANANKYIQSLFAAEPLRAPLLLSVIQSLELPGGSAGLDAGCGIGLQAAQLAESVGRGGRVVGLDILPDLLAFGKEHLAEAGDAGRVTFCRGDAGRLPFADQSFDWAWSADCIGYPAGDLAPFLDELLRVLKPKGSLILLGWSSQQVLPGYPLLEARLNAACSGYAPYLKGKPAEQNFLQAARWFEAAGFEQVEVRTYVGDVRSPLSAGERAALISLFDMLWGQPQPEVAPEDWEAYRRLCLPSSADFILDLPGYYAFFTYTVFRGRKPEGMI